MRNGKIVLTVLTLSLLGGFRLVLAGADTPPAPAEPGTLVIRDTAGKEHKLKAWKFTAGTRRLGWLAPPARVAAGKEDKPKAREKPAGPKALVLRDAETINYAAGVILLIPLEKLRSVQFDNEARTLSARVATSAKTESDEVIQGTTRYVGINQLAVEAEVDKGEAGIAEVTFRGGVARGGIQSIRFPEPKVESVAAAGRPAVVLSADKEVKRTDKVADLQALYRLADGQERLLPTLMFKKTLKVDLGKVKKVTASGEESEDVVWQVVQKDGDESTLTLRTEAPIEGKPAELLGLVGRVPAGYRLFPVRRIVEIQFDAAEEPKEKDKGKEKEKAREDRAEDR